MGLDKNLLFTDQYIEIQLTSIKENRKKQVTTSSYSILIEQQNSMFRKKIKNKVTTKKLSTYQVKKLIVLIGKLKPMIRSKFLMWLFVPKSSFKQISHHLWFSCPAMS